MGQAGLSAAVLLAPRPWPPRARGASRACAAGKFGEGVASGIRDSRAITLWTRVADAEGTGTVEVQVARDHGFRKIVARDLIKTTDATAHYAKARWPG